MIDSGLHAAAAASAILEWVALTGAGFALFRHFRYTVAEAAAYAIVSVYFLLSIGYQAAILMGMRSYTRFFDLAVTVTAVVILCFHRRIIGQTVKSVLRIIDAHRLAGASLLLVCAYLLFQALVTPSEMLQWHEFGGSTFFRLQQGLGPQSGDPAISDLVRFPSANQAVLAHLFLRSPSGVGIGLLSFGAYLAIGFATYALSRRYAWPATSLTVTLLIVSMPRFVFLATTANSEIIVTATSVFCLLAAYRAIERPNMTDLSLMACGIAFSITPDAFGLTHVVLLTILTTILLLRRHGIGLWFRIINDHRLRLIILLPCLLIFCQAWLGGFWPGPALTEAPAFSADYNPDGIQGAFANLMRYLFESAHFTQPLDRLCRYAFGFKLSHVLQHLHDQLVVGALGNPGTSLTLRIDWIPNVQRSWFGPFGLLLSIPAVVYAVRRAPRRLKTIAVGLICYWFLTSLILSWHPRNVGYFSFFFGCSGVCMALFLSPWRISRRGRRHLQLLALMLLLYAVGYNQHKPLFSTTGLCTETNLRRSEPANIGTLQGPALANGHPECQARNQFATFESHSKYRTAACNPADDFLYWKLIRPIEGDF